MRLNRSNIIAAAAVARGEGIGEEIIARVTENFSGMPHRLEHAGKRGGVDYYNDSKATNPGAVRAALEIMPGPVVWIAGGSDKGFDYTGLADLARRKVRRAYYLGEAGTRIEEALGETAEYRVLVGRNQDQFAVAGRVDIGGRDVWQDRTLTLAYIAGLVVFGYQRFHHIKNSFINGRVNNLALAGAFAVVQGG